jgi:hypothetical protein
MSIIVSQIVDVQTFCLFILLEFWVILKDEKGQLFNAAAATIKKFEKLVDERASPVLYCWTVAKILKVRFLRESSQV